MKATNYMHQRFEENAAILQSGACSVVDYANRCKIVSEDGQLHERLDKIKKTAEKLVKEISEIRSMETDIFLEESA